MFSDVVHREVPNRKRVTKENTLSTVSRDRTAAAETSRAAAAHLQCYLVAYQFRTERDAVSALDETRRTAAWAAKQVKVTVFQGVVPLRVVFEPGGDDPIADASALREIDRIMTEHGGVVSEKVEGDRK
jgi:hypothetical protein